MKKISYRILTNIASRIGFEITEEEFSQIRKAVDYYNKTYKKHLISLQN